MLSKETNARIYYHTREVEKSNFIRTILLFAIASLLALILAVVTVIKDNLDILVIDKVTKKDQVDKSAKKLPLL